MAFQQVEYEFPDPDKEDKASLEIDIEPSSAEPMQRPGKVKKAEKPEPEPEEEEEDATQTELNRLRQEMAEMKKALSHGFNNGKPYAPRADNSPAVLNDKQSNLLMGLLGR